MAHNLECGLSVCLSVFVYGFVGPKCVLNLDGETFMFTFIILTLDGGCTVILLACSRINMAFVASLWLMLHPG